MGLRDLLQNDAQTTPSMAQPSLYAGRPEPSTGAATNASLIDNMQVRIRERLLKKIDVTKLEQAGYASLIEEITKVLV